MKGKSQLSSILFIVAIIISTITCCKKSDMAIVTNNSIGNREGTTGKVFNQYPNFLTRNWNGEKGPQGKNVVVFIGELPLKKLLDAVSRDSSNWLSIERRYFMDVAPRARHAYLCIKFLVKADGSFRIATMNRGLTSDSVTAWSGDFNQEEKEQVVDSIYRGSDEIFMILDRYADPSTKNGSTLFHKLTGMDLRQYK
jgi:hypothetical protein